MGRTISMAVYVVGAIAVSTLSGAAEEEYRGQYWYSKYFGASDRHIDPALVGREVLSRAELQVRAFRQGFYNAHHLHHAANRPVFYALAREDDCDNEVAIVMDDQTGRVIAAVTLPH